MTASDIQTGRAWKLEILKQRSPILIAVLATTIVAAIIAQQAGQAAVSLVVEVVNANDKLSAQEILRLSAVQVLPTLPGRAAGETFALFAGTPIGWLLIAFTSALVVTSEHRWGTWPSVIVRRGTLGGLAVAVLLVVLTWVVAFLFAWATTTAFAAAWTGAVQESLPDRLQIVPELHLGRDFLSLGVSCLLVLVLVATSAAVASITRSAIATALVTLVVHVVGLVLAAAVPNPLLALLPANACVALLARLRSEPIGGSISQLSVESGNIPSFALIATGLVATAVLLLVTSITLRRSEGRR